MKQNLKLTTKTRTFIEHLQKYHLTERQKYGIFKYTMRKDLPRIYLDMDGVLCDFGAQIRKATGKSKEQWMRIDGRVKWDTVIDYPKFCSQL